MYNNYINIKVKLHHKKKYYTASTNYFNYFVYCKSDNLMNCLFEIKSKLNIIYHKANTLVLFTYFYYDPLDNNYYPLYTDTFNNLISVF
jgi:hypothetical protein